MLINLNTHNDRSLYTAWGESPSSNNYMEHAGTASNSPFAAVLTDNITSKGVWLMDPLSDTRRTRTNS